MLPINTIPLNWAPTRYRTSDGWEAAVYSSIMFTTNGDPCEPTASPLPREVEAMLIGWPDSSVTVKRGALIDAVESALAPPPEFHDPFGSDTPPVKFGGRCFNAVGARAGLLWVAAEGSPVCLDRVTDVFDRDIMRATAGRRVFVLCGLAFHDYPNAITLEIPR